MSLIIFIILAILVISFGLPFFYVGAWYAPSTKRKIDLMMRMINLKPNERVVDIGSGDGRIVIACAKMGAYAVGYEINPLLVWISELRIRFLKLRAHAKIEEANFWKKDFSSYDAVILFGVSYVMKGLEEKLMKELKPGTRVVSNYFSFPTWKPTKVEKGLYLYIKK